jgi:uncharacterized protein (TIGR00290 family)
MKKAFLNWSSGKDAACALLKLQQENQLRVDKLLTTVDSQVDRVSMHGLRSELLREQAIAVGIPLHVIPLKGELPLKEYNSIMEQEMAQLRAEGFTHSVFGDIFLQDLKEYRKQQLQKVGLEAVFPLWQKNTSELMQVFLKAGFKALTVSVNANVLDRSFCGRIIDEDFLAELPAGVDPAGENGEYHSFVFDGPYFREAVKFRKGEISGKSLKPSEEKGSKKWETEFWYCDLLPVLT